VQKGALNGLKCLSSRTVVSPSLSVSREKRKKERGRNEQGKNQVHIVDRVAHSSNDGRREKKKEKGGGSDAVTLCRRSP